MVDGIASERLWQHGINEAPINSNFAAGQHRVNFEQVVSLLAHQQTATYDDGIHESYAQVLLVERRACPSLVPDGGQHQAKESCSARSTTAGSAPSICMLTHGPLGYASS